MIKDGLCILAGYACASAAYGLAVLSRLVSNAALRVAKLGRRLVDRA